METPRLLKHMGWSYPALLETPPHIVDACLRDMHAEGAANVIKATWAARDPL